MLNIRAEQNHLVQVCVYIVIQKRHRAVPPNDYNPIPDPSSRLPLCSMPFQTKQRKEKRLTTLRLFLHTAKDTIVVFVTASASARLEIIFVGRRLATVLHLDILATTSELASSKALGLASGETVEEASV